MTPPALALAATGTAAAPLPDLDPLRRRLVRGGASSAEAVLVDFIEDDLRQAEAALALVGEHLERAARALRAPDATPGDLALLGASPEPLAQAEELGETLAALGRRLAQLAPRLAAAPRLARLAR